MVPGTMQAPWAFTGTNNPKAIRALVDECIGLKSSVIEQLANAARIRS